MFARRLSSKETTTLHWRMPDDAWVHWAQGRGEKSIRDVILEGIDQIRKSSEAVKKRCEAVVRRGQDKHEVSQCTQHEIKIQLPACDWTQACQRVGRVGTRQLLAALILESKSWQQVGNADAEFSTGWTEDALISSLDSLTATTAELRLGREEKILARMIAVAAVVSAVATSAGAVAAWCNP